MSGIVVGVDGSDHSRAALAWAIREAAHHQVPLTVMTVRHHPVRPATEIFWPIPEDLPDRSVDVEFAKKRLQGFVEQVAGEVGETAPEVTVTAVLGDPAEELVNASRDADLLVVGSRGGGGFARLLMGSVSSRVLHHAVCPVVVVPGTAQPR
jgi:nucleotide-binding universal stress UspA family protein